ncbi:hypothetical protein FRX31_009419, partial [Thalictrum thalictroides]
NSPVGHVYQDTCKLFAHLNIHEINIVTNNLLSADSMLGLDDIIIPEIRRTTAGGFSHCDLKSHIFQKEEKL